MSQGNYDAIRSLGAIAILIFLIFFVAIFGAFWLKQRKVSRQNANTLPESSNTSTTAVILGEEKETPKEAPKESLKEEKPKTLSEALSGAQKSLWGRISTIFSGSIEKDHLEEIEEVLYTSDIGPTSVRRLLQSIESKLSRSEKKDVEVVRSALREEMSSIFESSQKSVEGQTILQRFSFQNPSIWLIVGVNGAGKTTTIGKVSALLAQEGKKVLVAAGDTFRAAAGAQLKVWTERASASQNLKEINTGIVEIFSPEGVADPSAVAFDAVSMGKARGFDVIIIDTAGRLHTQQNLMEELKKMKRVMQKVMPEAPHETLLVLDSNQGQNALVQAKEFNKALELTGVVLTKMDGTAKGGVAIGVASELQVPIKLIGVGEKLSDLRPFETKEFVEAIL